MFMYREMYDDCFFKDKNLYYAKRRVFFNYYYDSNLNLLNIKKCQTIY